MAAKQCDLRRSAGTVIGALGAAKVFVPRWREHAQPADAAAIDRGKRGRCCAGSAACTGAVGGSSCSISWIWLTRKSCSSRPPGGRSGVRHT